MREKKIINIMMVGMLIIHQNDSILTILGKLNFRERSTFTFLALTHLGWLYLILNRWACTYCTSRSNDRALKDNSCRSYRSQNQ